MLHLRDNRVLGNVFRNSWSGKAEMSRLLRNISGGWTTRQTRFQAMRPWRTSQSIVFKAGESQESLLKMIEEARFRCAGHGKKKGSFCFNLSKDARSWEAAEQRCKRQGGSLAVIKDEETMLFITNLIRGSSYVRQTLTANYCFY